MSPPVAQAGDDQPIIPACARETHDRIMRAVQVALSGGRPHQFAALADVDPAEPAGQAIICAAGILGRVAHNVAGLLAGSAGRPLTGQQAWQALALDETASFDAALAAHADRLRPTAPPDWAGYDR